MDKFNQLTVLFFQTFVSEFHYHQNFLRGHVCVAGKNTSLNMQLPNTEQRYEMELLFQLAFIK